MNLTLVSTEDVGDPQRERLIFRAQDDTDLGVFLVLLAHKSTETQPLSGAIPHCYWFEDKAVKKGDTIVLYTKNGSRSEKENANKTTSYFYYWGFKAPMLKDGRLLPVLIESDNWNYPDDVHTEAS